jgi:hypothetical protein
MCIFIGSYGNVQESQQKCFVKSLGISRMFLQCVTESEAKQQQHSESSTPQHGQPTPVVASTSPHVATTYPQGYPDSVSQQPQAQMPTGYQGHAPQQQQMPTGKSPSWV